MKSILFFLLIFLFIPSATYAQETVKSNTVTTQIGSPTAPPPTSSGRGRVAPDIPADQIKQAITDQFKINMEGFSNENLKYIWKKFWDISETKFFDLVPDGLVIQRNDSAKWSEQLGCAEIVPAVIIKEAGASGVRLDETTFTVVVLHELGHVIYHCNDRNLGFLKLKEEHNRIWSNSNGITVYGRNHYNSTENFAEMITYYLHPSVNERTIGVNPNIPFGMGKHRDFFEIVKQILGDYPQS